MSMTAAVAGPAEVPGPADFKGVHSFVHHHHLCFGNNNWLTGVIYYLLLI